MDKGRGAEARIDRNKTHQKRQFVTTRAIEDTFLQGDGLPATLPFFPTTTFNFLPSLLSLKRFLVDDADDDEIRL